MTSIFHFFSILLESDFFGESSEQQQYSPCPLSLFDIWLKESSKYNVFPVTLRLKCSLSPLSFGSETQLLYCLVHKEQKRHLEENNLLVPLTFLTEQQNPTDMSTLI